MFQYTRGSGQGEGRLHRKRSVGIGGHISAVDVGADGSGNPYEEGMRRELDEEVSIDSPYASRCVGLINDDVSEVGRVHLGVVTSSMLSVRPCIRGKARSSSAVSAPSRRSSPTWKVLRPGRRFA